MGGNAPRVTYSSLGATPLAGTRHRGPRQVVGTPCSSWGFPWSHDHHTHDKQPQRLGTVLSRKALPVAPSRGPRLVLGCRPLRPQVRDRQAGAPPCTEAGCAAVAQDRRTVAGMSHTNASSRAHCVVAPESGAAGGCADVRHLHSGGNAGAGGLRCRRVPNGSTVRVRVQ